MTSSFWDVLKFLCCGASSRKAPRTPDTQKVRIRVGFDGKDTLIDPSEINVKTTFGNYAVLLDSDNQVIPLKCDGSSVEPLDPAKRYVVVLNTHGSSKIKWDMAKKGNTAKGKHKHHHKHHSSKHSKSKKREEKNKTEVMLKDLGMGGFAGFETLTVGVGVDENHYNLKDNVADSKEHLLGTSTTIKSKAILSF